MGTNPKTTTDAHTHTHTHTKTHTQKKKKEKATQTTLKMVIKTQAMRTRKKRKQKDIQKLDDRNLILIITLKVNGLNAPTKRYNWLNVYQNKTSIYVVYKRPSLDIGTHKD